jgi:transcriptional regulator with XRE-family HTH domain
MQLPGLRLRHVRESLGLTYRDVERASYELAGRRGRPEFILHISRLSDIENHSVVPSLHKLYTLAVIYHLNPLDIAGWYQAPLEEFFSDGSAFPAPETHLVSSPVSAKIPVRLDPAFDAQRTEFFPSATERWGHFGVMLGQETQRYRYGYIGLSDRRMVPLLRPGSIVLIDISIRRIEDTEWSTEYDRPMYFVEIHGGYRCGWFQQEKSRLVMQPHPLSRCLPEAWRTPEEAELLGKVIGVVTRLNAPWNLPVAESRATRAHSNRKVL